MNAGITHSTRLQTPKRFLPEQGRLLNHGDIRNPWRPSGAIEGRGIFAVVWSTPSGEVWAPLHDFDKDTRDKLIEQCAHADRQAGYAGAWPLGRNQHLPSKNKEVT